MLRCLPLVLVLGCQGPPAALEARDAAAALDAAPGDPDAAVADACDPLVQDCPAGLACAWAGPGVFACVASTGLPRYHACTASGSCSPGDGCHLDDRVDFYCVAYCDHATFPGLRDPDRCDVTEICGELDGDVGRCLAICDPLASSCPDGLACYLVPDAADLCFPLAAGDPPGAACDRDTDCAAGAGCLGDPPACTTYCDHHNYPGETEPRCASGEVCAALVDEPRIGACAVP